MCTLQSEGALLIEREARPQIGQFWVAMLNKTVNIEYFLYFDYCPVSNIYMRFLPYPKSSIKGRRIL